MKTVMVFNFETMEFEQASEDEGKELLDLIETLNADCVNEATNNTAH